MNEANHLQNSEEQVEGTNPSESAGANPPASPHVNDLEETQVKLWDKYSLKLPTLIALILWSLAAGYWFALRTEADHAKNTLAETKEALSETQIRASRVESDLKVIRKDYTELLKQSEVPVLLSPAEGHAVFGRQILFTWDYKHHRPDQRYALELRYLSMPNSPLLHYNVPNSQQKRMHLEINEKDYGDYLWRVYPGEYQSNTQFADKQWSGWNSFRTYKNVIDRIKQTHLLRVATNPTYYGIFNVDDGQGKPHGFDIDMVNWIGEQLAKELKISGGIKVVILNRGWDEMFRAVERREADLAVSTISRMVSREKKYPGLRFSIGYLTVHQVFIQAYKGGTFPQDLKGKTVGAASDSTNFEAAKHLKEKFGFKIKVIESPSYGDLFELLQQGQIDFGLVDHTATLGYRFGGWLDPYLGDFNRKTFGIDCEEYAIAVPYESDKKQSLLSMINRQLQSSKGKSMLQKLKNKYKIKDTQAESQ